MRLGERLLAGGWIYTERDRKEERNKNKTII